MTDVETFDFTPSWDFYDLMKDPGEITMHIMTKNMPRLSGI